MMYGSLLPVFERSWKRSYHATNFPNVWRRFVTKAQNGQIKVRIQDLTPDLYEEVWHMYFEHLYAQEELIRLSKMMEDEVSMYSEKWLIYQIFKENLSIIAVLDDQRYPKPVIVGGLLVIVRSRDDPPPPQLPGTARTRLYNLYGILANEIDMFKTLQSDRYFVQNGIVVKPEYRRLGIGTELWRTLEVMAKTFNITATAVICNNIKSQRLAAKLGYTVLNEVRLNEYVDQMGRRILPATNTKKVQACARLL